MKKITIMRGSVYAVAMIVTCTNPSVYAVIAYTPPEYISTQLTSNDCE